MIGSQTDLTDIDKLHYLKFVLIGEIGNKIKIFAIDRINYAKAGELLELSYEVKRILITRYLSTIMNLPMLDRKSTDSSSIVRRVLDHYVLVSGGSVRVSDIMGGHAGKGRARPFN